MVILPNCGCCPVKQCTNLCQEDFSTITIRFQHPSASGGIWTNPSPATYYDGFNYNVRQPTVSVSLPSIDTTFVVDRFLQPGASDPAPIFFDDGNTYYRYGVFVTRAQTLTEGRGIEMCEIANEGDATVSGFIYEPGWDPKRRESSSVTQTLRLNTGIFNNNSTLIIQNDDSWSGATQSSKTTTTTWTSAGGSLCSQWQSWPSSVNTSPYTAPSVGGEYGSGNLGSYGITERAIRRLGNWTLTVSFQ